MEFLLSLAALAVTCTALAQGVSEAILGYSNNINPGTAGQPQRFYRAVEQ